MSRVKSIAQNKGGAVAALFLGVRNARIAHS